jgi:adenylate kinase family enzyme
LPVVLVTGMSGTGKSSALAELARRGHRTVDLDSTEWSEWFPADDEWRWREDRVARLLAGAGPEVLFVCGTQSNQGRFYDRFDAVVLLSAPEEVMLARIAERTTNDFGKTPAQRRRILADLRAVEPLLRATCTHEIDAGRPLSDVVGELEAIASRT